MYFGFGLVAVIADLIACCCVFDLFVLPCLMVCLLIWGFGCLDCYCLCLNALIFDLGVLACFCFWLFASIRCSFCSYYCFDVGSVCGCFRVVILRLVFVC